MRSDTDFLHAPTGHLHLLLIPLCTLFFIIVILSYLCLSSISDRRCKVIADPQLGQVLLIARRRFLCKKAIRFSTLPKITGPIDSMLKAMAMYYTFLSFFSSSLQKYRKSLQNAHFSTHAMIVILVYNNNYNTVTGRFCCFARRTIVITNYYCYHQNLYS